MSGLLNYRRPTVEYMPKIAIPVSRQCCCYALPSEMVAMSLGLSDQRSMHVGNNTINDASVRHLASYGGPHTVCDRIIEATHF